MGLFMNLRRRILALLAGTGWLWESVGASAAPCFVSVDGLHVPPFATWETAATNIQNAIDSCTAGNAVVVSNGTYSLLATVRVTNQVVLTSLNGRETVLLDGSALASGSDAVFLQFGTLDGFTVSNSPRNGIKSEYGAIYNCEITHSRSNGIDSYTTPRIVTNSTLWVTNTIVRSSRTNGIYTCAVDTRIQDCVITESGGSGVSLRQNDTTGVIQVPRVSNFLIRASTVSSNRNSGILLAFYNYNAALPTVPVRIEDCLIEYNSGINGGGVSDSGGTQTDASSGVQIIRSILRRNSAQIRGGGVYFWGSRPSTVSRSVLEEGLAELGGGIYMNGGNIINSLVWINVATNLGGGIRIYQAGIVRNNTVLYNRAVTGGGVYMEYGGDVLNSIVYYNEANSYPNLYPTRVAYSCTTPLVSGAGNISTPPQLAGFRNWRLVPGSPCIDASLVFPEGDLDLEGDPRVWGGGVDMGCDEFYPPGLGGLLSVTVECSTARAVVGTPVSFRCNVEGRPNSYVWTFSDGAEATNTPFVNRAFATPGLHTAIVTATNQDDIAMGSVSVEIFPGYTNFVSPSGRHIFPFTNQTDSATTIQDAVEANIPGGMVRVADGRYDQGGAIGNGLLSNRVAITTTVAVVSENGPAFTQIVGRGPLGDDAVRCAYVAAGASLSGFTLTNGHTRASGDVDREQSGGGAWCEAGGQLTNCWIRNNAAHQYGGGVQNGTVRNSILWDNTAMSGGGANAADLIQCLVTGNVAATEGGGIRNGSLINSLVAGNQAEYGGGTAGSLLLHATVAYNHASQSGGGVYRGIATNSILFFNTAGVSWPNFFNSVCRYCCTTPDPQSTGNVTNDPQFADADHGLFRLRGDSPAIDSGLSTGIDIDLTGVPRPLPGTSEASPAPDMGAYEYTAIHFVAPEGAHLWPFLTWESAAHDLQSAIDAADPLDTVFASNGIYNTGGRSVHGALTNRVTIDKPIRLTSVNGHTEAIIEGAGPIGDAAIRGVYLGTNATLVGFTVRGGATRATGDPLADQSGGGIWCEPGAVISNAVVSSNSANAYGGGVLGGQLVNSFINGNTAGQGGGLAFSEIDFCTVSGNDATDGGGIYEGTGRCSIIYFNTASGDGPNLQGGAWDSCCTVPDPGGPGHLTNDPDFLASGDYRLSSGSPCIDATPAGYSFPAEDLDLTPRPLDGDASGEARHDLGAHEFIHASADTDGDGLGDQEEIQEHGTDPLRSDPDGDGQSDRDEVIAGMDPFDPSSYFAILNMSTEPGEQVFTWPGRIGRLYTILSTDDATGTWTNRPDFTAQPGVDGIMSFTNNSTPGIHLFGVRVFQTP